MWTSNCIEEVCEGSTNPERSFVVGWPTCNFVATFRYARSRSEAEEYAHAAKTIGTGSDTVSAHRVVEIRLCTDRQSVHTGFNVHSP